MVTCPPLIQYPDLNVTLSREKWLIRIRSVVSSGLTDELKVGDLGRCSNPDNRTCFGPEVY